MDAKKNRDNLEKLSEGIDLMESHMNTQNKQHEKLFAAEVKSRFM